MTPVESILWQHLRAKRFKGLKFRRQQIIQGFIIDFNYHSFGLVIEVDGKIHQKQVKYDTERDKILCAKGLYVLCFTNQQIKNLEVAKTAIARTIKDIKNLKYSS